MKLDHEPTCAWPRFGTEDEAAVLAILRDGRVSSHPVIRELEAGYATLTGRRHALAHCNGTAALLAAFHALDLQPGDEVLVPTATFWASVLPMLWCGLVPVFCESEADQLGPCPQDMAQRITPRTRAMVLVHLWGLPAKLDELLHLAERHGLKVIEDASHAHGAQFRDQPCGSFGDVSVFSLQGDKLAPAGEGGILLTDDPALHERATCLGDITRILELESPARRFAATSFGIKTRIASVSAALGLRQLEQLAVHNARRDRNHRYLAATLEDLGFDTFCGPPYLKRVWFEFLIRPRDQGLDRSALSRALQAEGLQVSAPRYPLLHQQPFFTEGHWQRIARLPQTLANPDPESLPRTQAANETLLRLPNFPGPDEGLLDHYRAVFRRVCGPG